MKSGEVINNWIDALQAAWPGVQVTFEKKDKKKFLVEIWIYGHFNYRTFYDVWSCSLVGTEWRY